MSDYSNYFEANKILWNKRTLVHKDAAFYNVEDFKKGKSSLNKIELAEVGDVKGKSLLHLQCHFGMDTLSWSRLGAKCTGVDLSDEAIKTATQLNHELGLDAKFICSNVYDLKQNLSGQFDIIFTSYGVIGWLPDLNPWAEIISHFLKSGGLFYIFEFHPVVWIFDDQFTKIKYSYFNSGVISEEQTGTYADRYAEINQPEFSWNHSLTDSMSALIEHGLSIEAFHEFSFSPYNCFNNTVKGEDGNYRIKGMEDLIPMLFSIKARKK